METQEQSQDDLIYWVEKFEEWWGNNKTDDASHDLGHFRRVYKMALRIVDLEKCDADAYVLLAAAYFHDVVNPPKDSDLRSKASALAAVKATEILIDMGYPSDKIDATAHAIEAHSFSAGVEAKTIEAKIIQDEDRMEALGAMGLARNMYVSGKMNSELFHPDDPLGETGREFQDRLYALDHFECKLFKLPNMMQTKSGKTIADERVQYLKDFRKRFIDEIEGNI